MAVVAAVVRCGRGSDTKKGPAPSGPAQRRGIEDGRGRSLARCHQPKAASCISAALRSSVWPGFSTGRSKGFQRSPTTCS